MFTPLSSKDSLTAHAIRLQVSSWEDLIGHVQHLPYGRISNATDLGLVLSEQKGTCSTKHALLKKMADLNGIDGVELVLGMYLMSEVNTPGIYPILTQHDLEAIPEAHCYLKVEEKRYDFTKPDSDIARIETDILEEVIIQPEQVGTFKRNYHRDYLRKYISKNNIYMSFETLWKIREACIQQLSG
ncbi:MAG: hypothetical protein AAF741_00995 [Bacteroidota bacterium]